MRTLYYKLLPVNGPKQESVFLPLRIKLLGEFVGITTVHAGRLLNELEESGVLSRRDGGILLYVTPLLEATERGAAEIA